MNLDMPLDEIINLNNQSSRGGRGSDRRDGRARGRRGGRRGQNVRSFGDSASSFVHLATSSAPPVRQSSGSTLGNGRALVSFLRPKRPTASDIAKSFIARRLGGLRHDLFEDAVGSALGIDAGAKLYISNLDYGVSNEDIKELFSEMGILKHYGVHYDRSGRSIGTADVEYLRKPDAIAAMNRYNNVQLDGKPMKIDLVGTNLMALPERTTYGSTLFGRGQPSLLMKGVGLREQGSGYRWFRGQRGSRRGGKRSANRGGSGRGSGKRRPSTEVRKAPTVEDLDADLEKYHKDAMQTS